MKKIVAFLLCAALTACGVHYGESEVLTEPGKVVDLLYVPAGHGDTSSVGVSTSGNLVFSGGSIYIPARYGIVFECTHGRFAIEGRETLWKRLKVGDSVNIKYKEQFRTYDDGRPKEVYDLSFVDAEVVK